MYKKLITFLLIGAALRRKDFLQIIELKNFPNCEADSHVIYAWYRLGCYWEALALAQEYRFKNAREIAAIAVSLAATGQLKECEKLINACLPKLRSQKKYAIEAARGISKFEPSLSLLICDDIAGANDLQSAAYFSSGNKRLAVERLKNNYHPKAADIRQGHFFLHANLESEVNKKLDAINKQLSVSNLTKLTVEKHTDSFRLSQLNDININAFHEGPLVSIIVPAYNAETHLQQSVKSVLQQSYCNLEIIIVDDGSTDRTDTIARDFVDYDSRVRLITFLQNSGAYVARNAGLEASTGQFVTVHDSDDFAHPQKIERQVRPMIINNNVVFTISDLVRISQDGVLGKHDVYPVQRLNTSSLTFQREVVLRDCGRWEEKRFGADSEFLFRLKCQYDKNQWIRVREPLTFAADHPASLTKSVPTGGVSVGNDPRRIAYTQLYTKRHLNNSRYSRA